MEAAAAVSEAVSDCATPRGEVLEPPASMSEYSVELVVLGAQVSVTIEAGDTVLEASK